MPTNTDNSSMNDFSFLYATGDEDNEDRKNSLGMINFMIKECDREDNKPAGGKKS